MLSLLCTAPQMSSDDSFPSTTSFSSSSSSSSSPMSSLPGTPSAGHSPEPSPRKPSRRPRMFALTNVSATFNNMTGSLLRRNSLGHARSTSASMPTPASSPAKAKSKSRVQIGSPSAFKHQFHLGPDSRTGTDTGSWDEERWRQVIEMRMNEHVPILNLVPRQNERASTSAERLAADASVAALLVASQENVTTSLKDDEDRDVDPAKAARAAKRASLIKRKPVPPLYPEEVSPPPLPQIASAKPDSTPASECAEPAVETAVSASVPALVPTSPASSATVTPTPYVPLESAPLHISIVRSASPPIVPPRRSHTLRRVSAPPSSPSYTSASASTSALIPSSTLSVNFEHTSTSALAPEAAEDSDASPRLSFSSAMTSESGASNAPSDTSAESAAPRTPTEVHDSTSGAGNKNKIDEETQLTVARVERADTESAYETADDGDVDADALCETVQTNQSPGLRSRRGMADLKADAAVAVAT